MAEAAPFAYIPNNGDNTVSVLDISTNTVVATIEGGGCGVAVNPDGTRVYVTIWNGVSVINTYTTAIVATIDDWDEPYGIAINPTGTRAYVTNVYRAGPEKLYSCISGEAALN